MKLFKRILLIIIFGALAALGVVFWPKIRECCDRWLAGNQAEDAVGGQSTPPVEKS